MPQLRRVQQEMFLLAPLLVPHIQLRPINIQATRQNAILSTEGTAEEQFQLIQASARQQALDNIHKRTQPTAPNQSHNISSMSPTEEQLLPDMQAVVTTSSSSFDLIQYKDDKYTASQVPRVQDKHLEVLLFPSNVQDIWSDDDDETPINTGTSDSNVQTVTADAHDNLKAAIKASIEADIESTDDYADDEDEDVERRKIILRR